MKAPELHINLATLTARTYCSEHSTGFVYFYDTRILLSYSMQFHTNDQL